MPSLITTNNKNTHLGISQALSAKQIMATYGKTFALAARLLKPVSRHDSAELYAFARTVDDLVDMQATSHQVKMQVMHLQSTLSKEQLPIQTILQKYTIPPGVLHAFLQAQIDDEDGRQIASQQCLINYAYGVAGSIGSMMRPILNASEEGEVYAVSLGIAMQLTNIARDLVEDAARRRIYIPATYFSKPIAPQTIQSPNKQDKENIFLAIVQLLNLAKEYYDFARLGYRHIPFRNRLSIAAAADMYRAIGNKILANGHARYWQGRVSINSLQKLGIASLSVIKTTLHLLLPVKSAQNNSAKITASIAHAIAHYQKV